MKRIAAAVGVEGAFLLIGTVCLSVASAFISPAGPLLVVGVISLGLGLAIAVQSARRGS